MASGRFERRRPPGGKRTFKEKLGDMKGSAVRAFKKAALVTVAAGALVGGPAYYNYGTIQEQEVTVRQVQRDYVGWDAEKYQSIYDNYRIVTDKGTLRNEDAMLHMKFNSDQLQETVQTGKIYRVKTYGNLPFGLVGSPNIISMQEVTQEELAERARLKEEERKQQEAERQQGGAVVKPGEAAPTAPATPGQATPGLSGAMTKVIITAEGYDIQMTVPAEVVNQIRIEKVSETKPVHIIQPPRPGG